MTLQWEESRPIENHHIDDLPMPLKLEWMGGDEWMMQCEGAEIFYESDSGLAKHRAVDIAIRKMKATILALERLQKGEQETEEE